MHWVVISDLHFGYKNCDTMNLRENLLKCLQTTEKNMHEKNLKNAYCCFHHRKRKKILRSMRFQNGQMEFPIVKDTTPNMMNPRLYTTSYNKPQGQQFDDTAVLSFIKLQYT